MFSLHVYIYIHISTYTTQAALELSVKESLHV